MKLEDTLVAFNLVGGNVGEDNSKSPDTFNTSDNDKKKNSTSVACKKSITYVRTAYFTKCHWFIHSSLIFLANVVVVVDDDVDEYKRNGMDRTEKGRHSRFSQDFL